MFRTPQIRLLPLLLLIGLLTASCTQPAEPPPTAPEPSEMEESTAPSSGSPQTIASNLEAPWSITFAGRTPILSERDNGRILELDSQGQAREIGTIPDVKFGGEGGLLGLAFREPDLLYVYSTGSDGNRIQRFTLEGSAGSFSLSEERTLLDSLPSAGIHNGGRMEFGPDGMLYVGAGDAGASQNAQDLDSLGGKILRLTSEGEVPADNPFEGSFVYSYGHRNVQGLAWDEKGTLYASEFGQNTWDELNIITPGGNYGWPEAEGATGTGDYTDPIAQWSTGEASPSGIAIHGDTLYMANLRGQRLRTIQLANPDNQSELFTGEYGRLRDVVYTPQGKLWILTNNTDGRGSPRAGDDRILELEGQD